MAPDDRDRMFDKALSRHLRSAGTSLAATNLPPASSAPTSSCFDLETLAAYHERSLLPEEMNFAKEHIVGCAHCQAILAQLELTDSIPLASIEKEEVPAAATAPATLAQDERHPVAANAAPSKKAASPRPIRGTRWAWLVPAGALAAGLLVWVGVHENQRPSTLSREKEVQMAKAQEPSPPVPLATREAPASPSTDQIGALTKNSRAIGAVNGERSRDIESLKQASPSLKAPSALPRLPAGAAGNAKELRKDAALDSSIAQTKTQASTMDEAQTDLDAKNASAGVAQDKADPQSQAALQNQNANILTQNQVLQQKVAGPSPLGQARQAEGAKKAKSPTDSPRYSSAAAPPAPPPSATASLVDSLSVEGRAIPNQHLIAAPNSSVRWLAGGAGLIEFSADNGGSWSVQTSGVTVDLFTGSAPSDKTCWMVGRAGTILLTTDGGAHWSNLPSPLKEDLGGIRASDALHATIWNSPKTKSFETSDGGFTWKPVPTP